MDVKTEQVDGAIVAVALHSYIVERERHRQRVTQLAASRIICAAERVGLRPVRQLQLLGFRVRGEVVERLSADVHLRAFQSALEANAMCRVLALVARFQGRSVDELECMQGGYRWRAQDCARIALDLVVADRTGGCQ